MLRNIKIYFTKKLTFALAKLLEFHILGLEIDLCKYDFHNYISFI